MSSGQSNMQTESDNEVLLVKYLLGKLSEEEQAQVEDRALADADYLGALEAAEADLIDAYVGGELPQSDRRAFERRFLTSPARLRKVEFARALANVAADSPSPVLRRPTILAVIRGWTPALRFAVAMAALICVAAPSWIVLRMRSRIDVLDAQRRDLATREQSLREQLRDSHRAASPVAASLILIPGLSRSSTNVQRLVLGPSTQIAHIQIQLDTRDDYPRFRVELRSRRGEEILTLANLPRHRTSTGYAVSFDVPATALPEGDYELALKGIGPGQPPADLAYFYFTTH
jgi:anti-sigma factor RsiW